MFQMLINIWMMNYLKNCSKGKEERRFIFKNKMNKWIKDDIQMHSKSKENCRNGSNNKKQSNI